MAKIRDFFNKLLKIIKDNHTNANRNRNRNKNINFYNGVDSYVT